MPITPGGADWGPAKDLLKQGLKGAQKHTKDTEIEETSKKADAVKRLSDLLQKEIDLQNNLGNSTRKLVEEQYDLNEAYEKYHTDLVKLNLEQYKENQLLVKKGKSYVELAKDIKTIAVPIRDSLSAYHQYNLALQEVIDSTGKFVGESGRARQEFDQLRQAANLTRDAGLEFAKTWSTGMRLGATNQQLQQMVVHLQKIRGMAGGAAAAQQVVSAPVSQTTMQGVMQRDPAAMVRAAMAGNAAQGQAIADLMRKPGNRPQNVQEAARFQQTEAWIGKIGDDIKVGMQAALAAGIGPEFGAMLVPLSSINEHVAAIAQSVTGIGQFLPAIAGRVGGLGGIFRAGLSGLGGLITKIGGFFSSGMGGMLKSSFGGLSNLLKMGFGGLKGMAGGMAGNIATGLFAKAGIVAAVGFGAGYVLDRVAKGAKQGSSAQSFLTNSAKVARVVGYGGAGAAIGTAIAPGVGTAIGGVAGAGYGIYKEFGEDIKFLIGGFKEKWKGDPVTEKIDAGTILSAELVASQTLQERLGNLTTELTTLPSALKAGLAAERADIAIQSADPEQFNRISQAMGENIKISMDLATKNWVKQNNDLIVRRNNIEAQFRNKVITKEERDNSLKPVEADEQRLAANIQNTIKNLNLGQAASVRSQVVETRTGQLGQEREAAAARYRLTAEISGDRAEILKYEQEINRTYSEEAKEIREGGIFIENSIRAQQADLKKRMEVKGLIKAESDAFQAQYDALENQLQASKRKFAVQEQIRQESLKAAQLAMLQANVTAYEREAVFKRAQQYHSLITAQQSLAKEGGATPEEVGGFAKQRASQSQFMLAQFMKNFDDSMNRARNAMNASRAEGTPQGEARAIQQEKIMFDLANSRVELERNSLRDRMSFATEEEQHRQAQLGGQRRILDIQMGAAEKVGASWRVVMGYQTNIVSLAQQEMESTRAELNKMEVELLAAHKVPTEQLEYIKKQGDLSQKQAELMDLTIGKQRGFLEKAIASSFGITAGGGSRVLPTVNPRIFGELIQTKEGMKMQGAPSTMEERRAQILRGLAPNPGIPGGGILPGGGPGAPAVAGAPGGPGAPVVAGQPAVALNAPGKAGGPVGANAPGGQPVGPGGVPAVGGPGAAPVPATVIATLNPADISGRIDLVVAFDDKLLVEKMRRASIKINEKGM